MHVLFVLDSSPDDHVVEPGDQQAEREEGLDRQVGVQRYWISAAEDPLAKRGTYVWKKRIFRLNAKDKEV